MKERVKKRHFYEYSGYGKHDDRKGSYLIKTKMNDKYISTLTTMVFFNKVVVEEIEIDDEKN